MIDRLKFRVYIKYAKKMCYDVNSFYIDRLKNKITIHFDGHTKTFKFDDVVLEQCTGAKDKNGNLVYEGDFIKTPNGSIGYIVWSQQDLGFYTKDLTPKEKEVYLIECEIIGNIHENPELLEVQDE